jgi:hypothetical protein
MDAETEKMFADWGLEKGLAEAELEFRCRLGCQRCRHMLWNKLLDRPRERVVITRLPSGAIENVFCGLCHEILLLMMRSPGSRQ